MSDVFAPDANALDQGVDIAERRRCLVEHASAQTRQSKRAFEEVKADGQGSTYMGAERMRLVTELANKLVERLNAGEADERA